MLIHLCNDHNYERFPIDFMEYFLQQKHIDVKLLMFIFESQFPINFSIDN